jgi:hypothetical protein
MRSVRLFLGIVLIVTWLQHTGQNEWKKIYGEDINLVTRGLIETYDGGYLIGGHTKYNAGGIKEGIIIKTDINGNELWSKTIGTSADLGTDGTQIAQTFDGGYILFSGTYKYGGTRNVMLMKLNKCGEKEWNKIFISDNQPQWNTQVLQKPDSTYLILLSYWGNDLANERIWLFNIDQDGEIIWQKVYADWTQGTNSEQGYDLKKNNDNEYLITGYYYQYNPGEDTNARWIRPMFIKIDSTGNEIWHLLWGVNEYYYGWETESVFNSNGDIYGVGKNVSADINGDKPVLHKVGKNGNQLYYRNIVEDSKAGGATTVSILEDSILFVGASWNDFDDTIKAGISKIDTLGNIIKQRILMNNNAFYSSIFTHDNKYLVTGNFVVDGNWDIYLWKFNRDLEYDSIYTQPRVYDSLCPYQIKSDTIDLDTTTVNLQELYEQMHQIKVYPNPAKSKITVTLGDLVQGDELKLYNINGQVVRQLEIVNNNKKFDINIHDLPSGMYVVALLNKGTAADKQKVIVEN